MGTFDNKIYNIDNKKLYMKPKAFLFDMNGTMIDDMQFHAEVWHDILNNDLKANLTKEEREKIKWI